jgi:hypothetical protein
MERIYAVQTKDKLRTALIKKHGLENLATIDTVLAENPVQVSEKFNLVYSSFDALYQRRSKETAATTRDLPYNAARGKGYVDEWAAITK